MKYLLAVLFPLLLMISVGIQAESLNVAVSVLPQKYFVKAIGGQWVQVQVMVRPGFDPATYEPTPRQLVNLSSARLYFAIGVPFEKAWLPRFRATNPRLMIIKTQAGIRRLATPSLSGQSITFTEPNPHIWLSPPLARLQAIQIRDALIATDPIHAQAFRMGYQRFVLTIDRINRQILKLLDPTQLKHHTFMIYHPALLYFAQAYGLHEISVQTEGKSPGLREMAELMTLAKRKHIHTIFVEPQFSQRLVRTLANELDARIKVINPLPENWPVGMLAIAHALRQTLNK